MLRDDVGLTKTYNRFHDPDERDADKLEAPRPARRHGPRVLGASGWSDVPTACHVGISSGHVSSGAEAYS
jgi:hypothetical protein